MTGVQTCALPILPRREEAWGRLARDLDPALLERISEEITLDQAIARARDLMDGRVRGRLVVRVT